MLCKESEETKDEVSDLIQSNETLRYASIKIPREHILHVYMEYAGTKPKTYKNHPKKQKISQKKIKFGFFEIF